MKMKEVAGGGGGGDWLTDDEYGGVPTTLGGFLLCGNIVGISMHFIINHDWYVLGELPMERLFEDLDLVLQKV